MKIKECMSENLDIAYEEDSVTNCAKKMGEKHIGCLPVCDHNNNLVGIVTDRDILLRNVACDKDSNTTKIKDIMTTNVYSCDMNSDIEEAERIMADEQVRRLPVLDNGKLVGIITLGDLATNSDIYEEDLCDTIEGICGFGNKNAQ